MRRRRDGPKGLRSPAGGDPLQPVTISTSRLSAATTVLFISIAMVSGPTPRGTGVSAPATDATRGSTSPTRSEPFLANSARRGESGANQASTVAASSIVFMPTSIDRRARLDERRRDEAGAANRHHQDVGGGGDARQVGGPRMADRDGGVGVQEHQRHRLADDVAAADHHGVAAGHRDVRAAQHLHHPGRRARAQRGAVLDQPPDVDRAEAVDVLVRIDGLEHGHLGVRAERRRQRRLHQDAVVRGAGVQAPHLAEDVLERGGRRQADQVDRQAGLAAGADLVANVDLGRRIRADQHDAERRRTPERLLDADDAPRQVVADRLADHHPVEHAALGRLQVTHFAAIIASACAAAGTRGGRAALTPRTSTA